MRGRQGPKARVRLAGAVIALAMALASAAPVRAGQTTHVVQAGENLYRIGLHYGVSWIDIMQANSLPNTTIYAGQALVIPLGEAAPTTPPPDSAPPLAPPQPSPSTTQTYTVQRGDTLFLIATRFGLSTAELAEANGISNAWLIYAGQSLTIPGRDSAAPGTTAAPAVDPALSGGKSILVDISEQHLYAYQGGTLVYSFVASTGMAGRNTRPGSFSVLNKIPNAYGSTWNIWMPNWLGIYWAGNLQNGIHALPILPGGGRLWEGYLGTPVSYGCVILGIQEAQLVYDWAEVGMPVTIQY